VRGRWLHSARVWRANGSEAGSAVIFALFVCLAVAVSIQVLTVAAVCGERALVDEAQGRRRLADVDAVLATLCDRAFEAWGPSAWAPSGSLTAELAGRLAESEADQDWVLRAEVRDSLVSSGAVTSVLVERARDGIDLPTAALVAGQVTAVEGRPVPWLAAEPPEVVSDAAETDETLGPTMENVAGGALGYVGRLDSPPLIGPGCRLDRLVSPWVLGDGWRDSLRAGRPLGPRVIVLEGEQGEVLSLPEGLDVSMKDSPVLLVATGRADLDLRAVGNLWGVVVVDGASVLLDGTVVHGAVYAGDRVDFGWSGQVVFSPDVLRWATDRSVVRARLVAGTRQEDTE
jgi:hypothetical protein